MSYFWTILPFLGFMIFIVVHEHRHKKREVALHNENERYMRPIAKTTSRMYEKQYGQTSTELENAFPDIHKETK